MSQFPNSKQRRGGCAFIRVLDRVDPAATHGFGFDGRNYRPGSSIKASELPCPALALECAPITGKEPNYYLWILWRFEFRINQWVEMARTSAADWTWALTLRPLAIRLMNPLPIVFDCSAIARALTVSIDEQLGRLPNEAKGDLLSALDVHLSHQIARLQ